MDTSPQTTLKLTDEITRQTALDRITTYLPLQAAGYECSTETLADVLSIVSKFIGDEAK